MVSVIVRGTITPDGKLELDLPAELQPGQVEVEIRQPEVEGVRLKDLLTSGLVGLWDDRDDIEDTVDYARSLRRRASRRDME
jgi:hypothetical protein